MLSKEFLAPYRRRGDNFPNLLARCTYLSKYSRENGKETWTDTIQRVVDASCDLDPRVENKERERLFHVFWTMQALPSGRGLWVGGVPGIPSDARYNCFSKETRFWADGRLVSFEDAVGSEVNVLCKDGQWRPAEIKNFGRQKLQRIVMKAPGRSNFAFEFVATANHRWFTSRGEVADLRVGDRLTVTPANMGTKVTTSEYAEGFVHGVIFGDGTKETQKEHTYKIRLCGEKNKKFEVALKASSLFYSSCMHPSYGGDEVLFFKSSVDLKSLPSDGLSDVYQAGFLAGWLAADGSARSDGRGGNRLTSINGEALAWVVDRAPLLGFCVTGYSIDPSKSTNFGPRSAPLGVLTLTTESVEYTVREIIDDGREEDVYCAVEPVTHSFTLEGGVLTSNCWYTTVNDIQDWGWVANQLMLGGGVGVGLEKIANLPVVERAESILHIDCRTDHPNVGEVAPDPFMLPFERLAVPDSREGWVLALLRTLVGAFSGTSTFLDVSGIRERGARIRTFGGTACGPGPLTDMVRSIWSVVRSAAGRKLNTVEALDVTNFIGRCIKAGNVRRSALIALGSASDQPFRDAKKDWDLVKSHRHTSNNSIVFRSWQDVRTFDWRSLVDDVTQFGEPGVLNLPLVWRTDPEADGVNPCFTGDTRLATQFGLVTIKELVAMGEALQVTTDNRVLAGYQVDTGALGTTVREAVPAFQTADAAEIYRVTTARGYSLRVTKHHKFPTPDGVLELRHLSVGDTLLLQSGEGQWGAAGSAELGAVIGWLEGDGNFNVCDLTCARLRTAITEMGYSFKGSVPEVVWRGSKECVRGYLRGLFGADGWVNWDEDKQSFSIQLSRSSSGLLHEVQTLLANFGIISSVYGSLDAEDQFYLRVSNQNAVRFADQIGFLLESHLTVYDSCRASLTCGPYSESFIDDIVSIECVGVEPTYCTTQPSHHTLIAEGVVTGNCGEQTLHNRESCNLAEVFPALFDGSVPVEEIFQLVTRYTLRQRLTPLSDPLAEAQRKKNMRIGVGLGGVTDFAWTEELLHTWYKVVSREADEYADALGVAHPITKTTVKPSGTISLLNGSNPGLHAPEAPFYIRRMRISTSEPMAHALMEAKVPHEYDIYDSTQNTLVFAFPMKSRNQRISAQTQTLQDQFERQLQVQRSWSDNAVSCTIKFDRQERDEMAGFLSQYVPQLKSVSMLPKEHGYAQAPYEAIDESTFSRLTAEIDHTSSLAPGDMVVDECEGGVCPVR